MLGIAKVIKKAFLSLQIFAVCKNFNFFVELLYLASKINIFDFEESVNVKSFSSIFLYSKYSFSEFKFAEVMYSEAEESINNFSDKTSKLLKKLSFSVFEETANSMSQLLGLGKIQSLFWIISQSLGTLIEKSFASS